MNSEYRLGLLGGGQLGRMSMDAANKLNINLRILDAMPCPASNVNATIAHIDGSITTQKDVLLLANVSDIISIEVEHVSVDALLEAKTLYPNIEFCPLIDTIKVIQDKYLQKCFFKAKGLPISHFVEVDDNSKISIIADEIGFPFLLKSRTFAYDGKGNYLVKSQSDIPIAISSLTGKLYAEKFVPFVKELAVMVVKSKDGQVKSYPTVETIQKDNICHMVIAPAQVKSEVLLNASKIAEQAVQVLDGAGIFGVELFLLADGSIYLNEIAPRPHNSGHYTMDACYTSQFEQHIRIISGLPLGSTKMKIPAAVMINILGSKNGLFETLEICKQSLTYQGATVHLYGKENRPGRKMGHINIIGETMSEVFKITNKIVNSTLTTTTPAENIFKNSPQISPLVSIIMGSDSDLPKMKAAASTLEEFGVPFEISIVSAHRTPERMVEFAKGVCARGIKVVIAAAGGAAHLPGMVAALTCVPVIGVPIALKYLDGVDSLHSIVQMPRGVPVATVAIDNSTNAALLAVRILGAGIEVYREKLVTFQDRQKDIVIGKVQELEKKGWKDY